MAPVLGYWDIRGLAEYIRYLLAYAGVEYEDKRYGYGRAPNWTREEWNADKYKLGLDFPNLPYYIDGDVKITQSLAILKYLGRKHGLVPDSDAAQRNVDIMEMQAFDLLMAAFYCTYDKAYTNEKRRQFLVDIAEKLRQLQGYLAKEGPFVAGKKVTYVDFLLYEALQVIRVLAPSAFKRDYPSLEQYLERVAALPRLRDYLASPRFKAYPFWSPFASQALGPQHELPPDDC